MTERMSPGFAVFNLHVNDAGTKAKKIFIKNFGQAKWDEVMQPLEEAGIMSVFSYDRNLPDFVLVSFYITTVTLLVNGDVVEPPAWRGGYEHYASLFGKGGR